MAERKRLSVNSTEFEGIKQNLKEFLKNQTTFQDYDFDGSGLSVLLDILAYNTYYQAFYNNMVANEMFLDSAVKRQSVVSLAKNLGYTPNSATAPTATVDLTVSGTPSSTTLLPGAQFTTSVNGQVYTFVNVDTANFDENNTITDLEIKQGFLSSVSYIVPDTSINRRYEIPEENVDISTIKVTVQESSTNTSGITDIWSRSGDLSEIDNTSKVYYLQENSKQKFEIYFGDGIFGEKLQPGNLVTLTYLVTDGPAANDAGRNDAANNRAFTYGSAANTVVVKYYAAGGSNKETTDQVRFKAPKAFSTQNRAVTANDYSTLIESNFSGFDSVFVFGGEDAEPPVFGTVFIAIKPSVGTVVTDGIKKNVIDFLQPKTILSITPQIIDPDYTFLRLAANVIYDPAQTSLPRESVVASIRQSMVNYVNNNIGKFGRSYSSSMISSDIDNSSTAIISSLVSVTMEKRFIPATAQAVSYELNYGNPIYHPHDGHMAVVKSNVFKYLDPDANVTKDVYIEDNGYGVINFYENANNIKRLVVQNAGTVDYENGIVSLNQVQILSPNNRPEIIVFAETKTPKLDSVRERILFCDFVEDATAIQINLAAGSQSGTSNNVR
jgi:hypothetical protein